MQAAKMESAIKRALELSADPHNVFTPLSLCEQVTRSVPATTGSVLVLTNLEFICALLGQGVSKDNIYFATPCETKAFLAEQMIQATNVFHYTTIADLADIDMKFDAVVGNPPYQHGSTKFVYKQFMESAANMLTKEGTLAFIVPANWLSGRGGAAARQFRQTFSTQVGMQSITLHPVGTFTDSADGKPILTVTAAIIAKRGYTGTTTLIREIDGQQFKTDIQVNGTNDNIRLFFGDIGKSIWEKAEQYHKRMVLSTAAVDGPNVHFSEKCELVYYGQLGRNWLSKTRGNFLLTGVICDHDNSRPYLGNGKRYKIPATDAAHADRIHAWMNSKMFAILLATTSVQSSISGTTVGALPLVDDYEGEFSDEKIYAALGLSTEEVNWINTTFVDG